MYDGKKKALTFSYDDGVLQDIRLIGIFNRYGLKATFNLNSGLLGKKWTLTRNGVAVDHTKHDACDIKHIYDGHEVACHTLNHPSLIALEDDNEVVRQVEQDRLALSELVGYEVFGFAYPGGAPNCNDRVAELIKNNTGVKYARTVPTTQSFEPCRDLFQFKGTLYHHEDWDRLFEMGEQFLYADSGLFYIWGHSYEFDIYPERWQLFEEFCKMMSGKADIFYGTNIEVLK